ncbi:MAG: peptide deformylase [Candidatus Bipolaricaulota bacterium]|nr:peptide deformylase [Candidatus Bipolaricaulota bacterium]
MALKIRVYPDAVLRRRAQPVAQITDELRKFADALVETMVLAKGYGLAAPQVGVLQRIIAIDVEQDFYVLINPEILWASDERLIGIEGCLSIPGIEAEVERPRQIRVRALNLDGQEILLEKDDLVARVLQHEIDHLDGILFIDHLSQAKRLTLLKEYERLKKTHRKSKAKVSL